MAQRNIVQLVHATIRPLAVREVGLTWDTSVDTLLGRGQILIYFRVSHQRILMRAPLVVHRGAMMKPTPASTIVNYLDYIIIQGQTPDVVEEHDYVPADGDPDIVNFFNSPGDGGRVALLIGALGSGKTTSLRFLARHDLATYGTRHVPRLIVEVNYNSLLPTLPSTSDLRISSTELEYQAALRAAAASTWEDLLLASLDDQISRYCRDNLGETEAAHDEFISMWDWAVHPTTDSRTHPSIQFLGSRVNEIIEAGREQSDLVGARRRLRISWNRSLSTEDRLRYTALRICYLLLHRFGNDGRGICVLIDNIDSAPAAEHYNIIDRVRHWTSFARCRTLIAARPHTIRNVCSDQRLNLIATPIAHRGPSVADILSKRLDNYLIKLNDESLAAALSTDINPPDDPFVDRPDNIGRLEWTPKQSKDGTWYMLMQDSAISFAVIRAWAERLANRLRETGRFRQALEVLSEGSIRVGKILFSSFCHAAMPWDLILGLERLGVALSFGDKVRAFFTYVHSVEGDRMSREVEDALWVSLLLRRAIPVARSTKKPLPGVYNLFRPRLIVDEPASLATLRLIRAIQYLSAGRGGCSLSSVWELVSPFGYSNAAVIGLLNMLKHESRRFIDVDYFGDIPEQYPLASAGWLVEVNPIAQYYTETLACDIDYVVSCFATSEDDLLADVVTRMSIVQRAVECLVPIDAREIIMACYRGAKQSYTSMYGSSPWADQFMQSLSSRAIGILNAHLGRVGRGPLDDLTDWHAKTTRIRTALETWTKYVPHQMFSHLQTARAMLRHNNVVE